MERRGGRCLQGCRTSRGLVAYRKASSHAGLRPAGRSPATNRGNNRRIGRFGKVFRFSGSDGLPSPAGGALRRAGRSLPRSPKAPIVSIARRSGAPSQPVSFVALDFPLFREQTSPRGMTVVPGRGSSGSAGCANERPRKTASPSGRRTKRVLWGAGSHALHGRRPRLPEASLGKKDRFKPRTAIGWRGNSARGDGSILPEAPERRLPWSTPEGICRPEGVAARPRPAGRTRRLRQGHTCL